MLSFLVVQNLGFCPLEKPSVVTQSGLHLLPLFAWNDRWWRTHARLFWKFCTSLMTDIYTHTLLRREWSLIAVTDSRYSDIAMTWFLTQTLLWCELSHIAVTDSPYSDIAMTWIVSQTLLWREWSLIAVTDSRYSDIAMTRTVSQTLLWRGRLFRHRSDVNRYSVLWMTSMT